MAKTGRIPPRRHALTTGFIQGLQGLLKSGTQLPTLPTIVFQIHAVLDNERKGPADVASVIERDPALTTRLLRAANSAFYSRGSDRVASVHAAIQRIGLNQVRGLCLVLSVVQAFGSKKRALSHESLWAHSGAVGATARYLWVGTRATGVSADDLYVAGLLHDVGLLVMDQFFPEEFDRLAALRQEIELPLWQHEEDLLGMDHGEVGGLLLGSWSLPEGMVNAVTYHHRVEEAPEQHQKVCAVVHAAELLCSEEGWGLADEQPLGGDGTEALTALGFPPEQIPAIREDVRAISERAAGLT
jgi:HD-like signal output (HDOD) protein